MEHEAQGSDQLLLVQTTLTATTAHVISRALDESDQTGNIGDMETPSPLALAAMILAAPGWARVGIAAPSQRVREAAALELGAIIAERIVDPVEIASEGQMALPL